MDFVCLKNFDINIVILENIDIYIDIDMDFLENVDIDKGILQNIDINKILYQKGFGISNTPTTREELLPNWRCCCCNTELTKTAEFCTKIRITAQKEHNTAGCVLEPAVHALGCSLDQENLMFELGGAPHG